MYFHRLQESVNAFLQSKTKAALYYDTDLLAHCLKQVEKNFAGDTEHTVAIKTNPHPDVLKYIINYGFGLEAASIEEVKRVLSLGANPSKIIFDSPAKTVEEILFFDQHCKGGLLNANCLAELKRVPAKPNFRLGLRINPVIDSGAPTAFNVSTIYSKFGVPLHAQSEIHAALKQYPISCLHMHVGSDFRHFEATALAIRSLVDLAKKYPVIKTIDIGGGLPAENEDSDYLSSYATTLIRNIPDLQKYHLVTEFGRYYHQHAGIFISRVEYALERGGRQIPIIHAGADLFLREVYLKKPLHPFLVFGQDGQQKKTALKPTHIGGPLCFAADYLAENIMLPEVKEGDLIVMLEAGANNLGMWSNHCSRTPIPMHVL